MLSTSVVYEIRIRGGGYENILPLFKLHLYEILYYEMRYQVLVLARLNSILQVDRKSCLCRSESLFLVKVRIHSFPDALSTGRRYLHGESKGFKQSIR